MPSLTVHCAGTVRRERWARRYCFQSRFWSEDIEFELCGMVGERGESRLTRWGRGRWDGCKYMRIDHEDGRGGGSYPWVDRKAYTYGGIACSVSVDVMLEGQQYIFVYEF